MMRTKILIFEYILAMFFALQVIFPLVFTPRISLATFLAIMFLKYNFEGLRMTFFFFVIIQASLLIFSHPMMNISLTLCTYFILTRFPVFEFPETKGPFLVGFKDLTLAKTINLSVFYPTFHHTKSALYKSCENGYIRIYDIMRSYPGHFIPKFVYKVLFSFLDFMDIGTNQDAPIISPKLLSYNDKFPVIIFSHGLSANRNLYTGFARQWASYGYVVFCIDHDEPIYMEFINWETFRKTKFTQLDERCKVIQYVIDFALNPKEIKSFFNDNSVDIDHDRLSLAGHSFGSAAVAQLASVESRITGALLLLDPWLYPVHDNVLDVPARKPVLVLRTESFENVFEEFKVKQKIQQYIEANKDYKDQTLSCYFKNTSHNSFCDLIIHMPKEMQMFGIVQNVRDVEEIYNSQTMITQIFLDLMLYSQSVFELASKRTMVIKAFESYSAKNGGKSELQVDSF